MGEIINKYQLQKPFQNRNAGFSRWTTATIGSRRFFLKELMNPKYPDDESLQESLRAARINECRHFEEEKTRLFTAINEASDGNLVRIVEFFRADSRYYISSDWIDHVEMSFKDIARLDLKEKLLMCRTAAHSLAGLHEKRVVHADIKDTNVLIHKTKGGRFVTKIVDFGCSFFEGSPPDNEDELGGDQVYLSPEACLFVCGEEAELTCKMDVFALGLLIHQYLTGELPYFDGNIYNYAHEAVLDDVILKADTADIPLPVREIIEHMLVKDAEKRISAQEAYFQLTAFYEKSWPVTLPFSIRMHESEESISSDYNGAGQTYDTTYSSPNLKMSRDFYHYHKDETLPGKADVSTLEKRAKEKTPEVYRGDRDWNREKIKSSKKSRNTIIFVAAAAFFILVLGIVFWSKFASNDSYLTEREINDIEAKSGVEDEIPDYSISEEAVTLNDSDVYPIVFDNEITDCKKIKVGYTVFPEEGDLVGRYICWVRSDSDWKQIGTFEIKEVEEECINTFNIDPPLTFDAIVITLDESETGGDATWTSETTLYEIDVEDEIDHDVVEDPVHTHKWENATCVKPKTCSICGKTTGAALGHNWKDATYDDPKTCKRCGITIGNVRGYVSGDSLSDGSYSEEAVSLGDYEVYPWIFTHELKKCKKIKIGYEITIHKGNPLGTFECWIQSNGEWKLIGTIEVKQADKEYTKTYNIDPALDVEAVLFEPQNDIDDDEAEWISDYMFYEAQVE